jgi:type II secretory pathway pseudopilin PulG
MMRKCLWHKQLRLRYGLSVVRPAFTLAELVVSIGILVLMMSLVGQVFNLTVKSTGQATALTEVMQQLRAFEQTLRDDLRGVQPGNSLILIQGNPVNAYWTQSGKDADDDPTADGAGPSTGYPHAADPERETADGSGNAVQPRADILMIFTARPAASFVEAGTSQLTSNLQQVVYGHAELGEYVPSGVASPQYTFERATGDKPYFPEEQDYPSPTGVAAVPAAQWHLARRSVLLLPNNPPVPPTPPLTSLDDPRLLECQTDVFQPEAVGAVRNFRYEDDVLRPQLDPTTSDPMGGPWFLPRIFGDVSKPYAQWKKLSARSKLDPAPPALYANRIGDYLLPNCASFKVEWTLNPRSEFVAGRLDGVNEVFWFDPGDNGDPANTVRKPDPLRSLGDRVAALKPGGSTACATNDTACRNLLKNLDSLLNQRSYWDALPAYSLSDRFRGRNFAAGDPDAWDQLAPDKNRPNLVVFTATRPAPPPTGAPVGTPASEPVLDPMFPGALRITIDVFDKERRLDRPIRHVMVIPIGG